MRAATARRAPLVGLARALRRGDRVLHDRLAGLARRRGWRPVALTYPGYGGGGVVRVLARVLLAPAGTDPAARRDIPGWRRFLTLELPGCPVSVQVDDATGTATSDTDGLVDVTVVAHPPPGCRSALVTVGDHVAPAPVHVAREGATLGVVCDIDDTVWVTDIHRPLVAARRTFFHALDRRRPVEGMSVLLRRLAEGADGGPVVYLSNGPWNLAGAITSFLERHGFPSGALLLTDWGLTETGWFRSGRLHKRQSLERLAADFPDVRWVLVGDDGEHDPDIYASFVAAHPERVRAVALRQVRPAAAVVAAPDPARDSSHEVRQLAPGPAGGAVPAVLAGDGRGLLAGLERLGVTAPAAPSKQT